MAAINDLIAQIQDVELRNKIEQEVNRMNKQKKFDWANKKSKQGDGDQYLLSRRFICCGGIMRAYHGVTFL